MPEIQNGSSLGKYDGFIVAGMGGSHWGSDILRTWKPELDLIIHSDYGFPAHIKDEWLPKKLFIASSYSGNTEETIDALAHARKKNMAVAVISVGGKLLEIAKRDNLPYIQFPETGIQPRSALGFSIKALLRLMRQDAAMDELRDLSGILDAHMEFFEKEGETLANRLTGYVPIIYSSSRNSSIAHSWRIKFNETGKIPAFSDVFPEMNHNGMTGFDVQEKTKTLSERFYFLMLKDAQDHPQVQKRMEVTSALYRERGLRCEILSLEGGTVWEKIFSSLLIADFAAYHTAMKYGVEAEQVPMVEELKKRIAD